MKPKDTQFRMTLIKNKGALHNKWENNKPIILPMPLKRHNCDVKSLGEGGTSKGEGGEVS